MIDRVIVTGPPASGKSSLIEYWNSFLASKKKLRIIDDFLVLREICPENVLSSKYKYQDGALVLNDSSRKEIMENQYKLISKRWYEDFDGLTILELSSPKIVDSIGNYFCDRPFNLVVVNSTLDNIKKRNKSRDSWKQIPEVFIDMFSEENYDFVDALAKYKPSVLIENDKSMVDLENFSIILARDWFEE